MTDPSTPLPAPTPGVMCQELDDGAVLFSPATEIYFGLNHVGAAVWSLLPPASATLDELCSALVARYPDAPPERLADDVERLLGELAREGLVVRSDDDA